MLSVLKDLKTHPGFLLLIGLGYLVVSVVEDLSSIGERLLLTLGIVCVVMAFSFGLFAKYVSRKRF